MFSTEARWEQDCSARCGYKICKGEQITRTGSRSWKHFDCNLALEAKPNDKSEWEEPEELPF